MHCAIQHCVVLVIEWTADIDHIGEFGWQANALGERCRNGGAGEYSGVLVPHAGAQGWPNIERRNLKARLIGGARYECHVTSVHADRRINLLHQTGGLRLPSELALLGIFDVGVDGSQRRLRSIDARAPHDERVQLRRQQSSRAERDLR